MKLIRILIFLAFILFLTENSFAQTSQQLNLEQCFQLTLEKSERIKISNEEIKLAEARYQQALSAPFPKINLEATQRIRDNKNFGTIGGNSLFEESSSGTTQRGRSIGRTQLDGIFTLEQPIFSGFRDFLIAQALESEISAQQLQSKRISEILYGNVAELYFQILALQKTLDVLKKTEQTLNSRIVELRNFIALGKSRESEVHSAQSDLADNEVLKEQTRGALDGTKELLSFLTGITTEELILDPQITDPALQSLDVYLMRSKKRLDLQSIQYKIASQQYQLTATKRKTWPTLSLNGDAYPYEDPDRNRSWDLSLQASIPIFEAGLIKAQSAEQQALLNSLTLSKKELQRLIERDVKVTFSKVISSQKELKRLKTLKTVAEKDYNSQHKDYELGVVTNLQVLDAIRRIQNIDRRILETQATLESNFAHLEVAAGGFIQ